ACATLARSCGSAPSTTCAWPPRPRARPFPKETRMTDETIGPRSDAVPPPDPQSAAAPVAPAPEPPAATPAVGESMLAAPAEPSAYEAFRLPDGVTVDAEQLAEASELFRSASLSQEQAQKFVDLAVARETQAAQRGLRAFVDLQNKWVSEIK